jgi:PPIC-type PPIASE domain
MSHGLQIGQHQLDGGQIITALVRYQMLETLVGQILLDEQMAAVPLSRAEVFRALGGSEDEPVPEDFGAFLTAWCAARNTTLEYFNDVMLRELRLQKFQQVQFAQQVESEFLRTKSDLDQVEFSLIQLDDLALAQEVYFHLRDDGAEFAALAQQYSLGNERQAGGWVGPVALSALPVEVAEQFCRQQEGSVYGPIAVADRFWVVRLERFIAARLTDITRANLRQRLYRHWLQSQVKAFMAQPGAIVVQPS